MERKHIFNLLKPISSPKTVWDKVYDWIVGRARIVILVVEVLIAIAFFSKVYVDTVAKNKDKEIANITTQLNFYAQKKEPEFRAIQRKDADYTRIWNQSSNTALILQEIYAYINNPSLDVSVKIDGEVVSIYGKLDLETLKRLEESIESSETYSSAYIDALTLEQQDIEQGVGQYVLIANLSDNFKFRTNL